MRVVLFKYVSFETATLSRDILLTGNLEAWTLGLDWLTESLISQWPLPRLRLPYPQRHLRRFTFQNPCVSHIILKFHTLFHRLTPKPWFFYIRGIYFKILWQAIPSASVLRLALTLTTISITWTLVPQPTGHLRADAAEKWSQFNHSLGIGHLFIVRPRARVPGIVFGFKFPFNCIIQPVYLVKLIDVSRCSVPVLIIET